ncbi:EAL domain-containing protein [Burkholderia multivorans]|nr:EAL domain-containing protein [Burkholderia multivorans]
MPATEQNFVPCPALTLAEPLAGAMRIALLAGEFQVHYQPVVTPAGNLHGCEALVRWPRGTAPTSPAEFIPIAERSGLIVELGAFVLKESMLQYQRFCRAGLAAMHMNVNVSPCQLEIPGFADTLEDLLTAFELPANKLTLELTEGTVITDLDEVVRQMGRVRELGVRLALDDYGTGQAGLTYLQAFPVSALKIDRSFVQGMETSRSTAIVVKSVVDLAKALELEVVAEGIETIAQAKALASLGTDFLQGYLFGPPMSGSDFIARFSATSRQYS